MTAYFDRYMSWLRILGEDEINFGALEKKCSEADVVWTLALKADPSNRLVIAKQIVFDCYQTMVMLGFGFGANGCTTREKEFRAFLVKWDIGEMLGMYLEDLLPAALNLIDECHTLMHHLSGSSNRTWSDKPNVVIESLTEKWLQQN